MEVNRREFGLIVLGACACGGCNGAGAGGGAGESTAPPILRVIDAGPVAQYSADGVYPHFRHAGFFIVTEGGQISAISSDCTHRDCPLRAMPDRTFSCRCHGSHFDDQGHVLKGPAQRDLPHFPYAVNENQHLIVQVTRLHFDEE